MPSVDTLERFVYVGSRSQNQLKSSGVKLLKKVNHSESGICTDFREESNHFDVLNEDFDQLKNWVDGLEFHTIYL